MICWIRPLAHLFQQPILIVSQQMALRGNNTAISMLILSTPVNSKEIYIYTQMSIITGK